MIKNLFVFIVTIFLVACGGSSSSSQVVTIKPVTDLIVPTDLNTRPYLVYDNNPIVNTVSTLNSSINITNSGGYQTTITNITYSSGISGNLIQCDVGTSLLPSGSCELGFNLLTNSGNGMIIINYSGYSLVINIMWYTTQGVPLIGIYIDNPISTYTGSQSTNNITIYNLTSNELSNVNFSDITNSDTNNTISYNDISNCSTIAANSNCNISITINPIDIGNYTFSFSLSGSYNNNQSTYSRMIVGNYMVQNPPFLFSINPSSIQRGQYTTLTVNNNATLTSNQILSISNSSLLNDSGIRIFSAESRTNPVCIMSSSNTNCSFLILASSQSIPGNYNLNISNSGTISYSYNISMTINSNTSTVMYPYGYVSRLNQTGILPTNNYVFNFTDANYNTGFPWSTNYNGSKQPLTRFYNDGCRLYDYLTGLIWYVNGYYDTYSNVLTASATTICGETGWRIPNINELRSLANVNYWNGSTITSYFRDYLGFKNLGNTSSLISSSISIFGESQILAITPGSNDVRTYLYTKNSTKMYFILVKTNPVAGSNPVPATGQTMSAPYTIAANSGYDGTTQAGVPILTGSNRYYHSGDCTYDKYTGLTWSYYEYESMTFESAINFGNSLNICGYTDWRLPNIFEVQSLSSFNTNQVLYDVLSPYFAFLIPKPTTTDSHFSWTNTPSAAATNYYFTYNINSQTYNSFSPDIFTGTSTVKMYARYVRGGNF